jgi:GNAT superfamily N-acetyltransferase
MIYRFAITSDAALLARLNKQLIDDEGHRNTMTVAQLEERMRDWLSEEYQAVLFQRVAETLGYALFRREPEYVYLRQFFVCCEHRRRGIGRDAIAWLRQHAWGDCARLRLDVLVGNNEAIAFWRSVGFRDYCVTMELES